MLFAQPWQLVPWRLAGRARQFICCQGDRAAARPAATHHRQNLRSSSSVAAAFQHLQDEAAQRVWRAFQEARRVQQDGEDFVFADKGNPNLEQFNLLYTGRWMGSWAAKGFQPLSRRRKFTTLEHPRGLDRAL